MPSFKPSKAVELGRGLPDGFIGRIAEGTAYVSNQHGWVQLRVVIAAPGVSGHKLFDGTSTEDGYTADFYDVGSEKFWRIIDGGNDVEPVNGDPQAAFARNTQIMWLTEAMVACGLPEDDLPDSSAVGGLIGLEFYWERLDDPNAAKRLAELKAQGKDKRTYVRKTTKDDGTVVEETVEVDKTFKHLMPTRLAGEGPSEANAAVDAELEKVIVEALAKAGGSLAKALLLSNITGKIRTNAVLIPIINSTLQPKYLANDAWIGDGARPWVFDGTTLKIAA